MATPISSATSYATATQLMNAHDANKIGDYATDGGVRLNPGDILTNTVVAAALLRASGQVEMACTRGGRYSPTDLADLTGASEAALVGIVCDLAFYHLAKRRIPKPENVPGYKEAMEVLQALSQGELIFGLQEAMDAGNMSRIDTSTDSSGALTRPTDVLRRRFGRRMQDFTNDPLRGF